jgi:hypothetical protein
MSPRAQRRAELPASVGKTSFRSTPELLSALERMRIIPVPQAAQMNNLSTDTFRRQFSHLILKLSNKRIGVRLGPALDLARPIDDGA